MKGVITAVQRMSIHDGPGIRSTVFLKGCNFRCRWCHNPETWSHAPQLQQITDKCILCKSCVDICPKNALTARCNKIEIDRRTCDACGKCATACTAGALNIIGRHVDSDELVDELFRDLPYYEESGGGVTISGGEPFAQFEFTQALLSLCKSKNIHTAVETNLSCPTEKVSALLPYVDLWMVDLKTADDELHKRQTAASNRQTIANLKFLSLHDAQIVVRTPVVPEVNDNAQEIENICKELSKLNILKYELLSFHSLGFDKFAQFGMENPMSETTALDMAKFTALKSQFATANNINNIKD